MLGNSNEFGSKFTHQAMQDFASYSRTMNMATQAIAKTNANISTTGTAHAVINGVHIASLTAETGRTLANDKQFTIWVTATAYTAAANDCRYVADSNGHKQWYKCIADHTSAATTKPGQSDNVNAIWRTYWTESTNKCEPAVGTVSASGITRYFLALADNLGVVTTVIADNGALATAAQSLVIPHFDPEVWCAIGLYTLTATGPSTWGTTDDNAQVTETQLIGPVYPTDLTKDQFSLKAMQDIMAYSRTQLMASMTVKRDDNDLQQTTGAAHAVIDGVHDETLAKDPDLTISTDLQLTIWLTATAYTAAASCRYVEDANGHKQWYHCILDHTSSAATKPGQPDSINATWKSYWVESSNRAIQAAGTVTATGYSRWILVLAHVTTGIMTTVLAGPAVLDANIALFNSLVIPAFDPKYFVAIALLKLNADADTWGTTDSNGVTTVTQLVGPVYPSGLGIDNN